jgi:hypothetical protein
MVNPGGARALLVSAALAFQPAVPPAALADADPPPEVEPGADYVAEPRDSVGEGELEVAWRALGANDRREVSRQESVRFRAEGLEGDLRDGADPLGTGELTGAGRAGEWRVGRLAPRWAGGLLLGTAPEPWSKAAPDRGGGSALRGRAGDGVRWRGQAGPLGMEALAGRFDRRDLGAGRISHGTAGRERAIHWLHGAGRPQMGAGLVHDGVMLEWAGDTRGRWRAEVSWRGLAGPWRLQPALRLGKADFRSVAEPRRAGPARLVSLAAARQRGGWRLEVSSAQWQWQRGRDGSRVAVEVGGPLAPGSPLALGWEERHGPQRERSASGPRRQSWWGELQGGSEDLRVTVRHERAGGGAWGAQLTRTVTTMRAEGRASAGVGWSVAHAVHDARAGDLLYVRETEPGRLVLRALSGRGQRTVARLSAPAGRGRVEVQAALGETVGRPARLAWQVRWVRRARLGVRRD